MLIRRFAVSGYRSFGDRLELRDLGQAVVLFGRNNAGKSNLLRALDLFHHLAALPLVRLVDGGTRQALGFYAEFGQDAWMFHQPGGDEVLLSADLAEATGDTPLVTIGFAIRRDADGINLELTEWSTPELGDQAEQAGMDLHLLLELQMQRIEQGYEDEEGIYAQKAAWDAISAQWEQQRPAVGAGIGFGGARLPSSRRLLHRSEYATFADDAVQHYAESPGRRAEPRTGAHRRCRQPPIRRPTQRPPLWNCPPPGPPLDASRCCWAPWPG